MMKTDSHYSIGHSHLYVQDYALAASDGSPHMIVADGCSSAQHADIGARLIALAARQYLTEQVSLMDEVPDAMTLATNVAWRAHAAARLLGISHTSIDATLLLVFVKNDVVHAYVLGDGVIAIKEKNTPLQTIAVNYSSNAPYYPAYLTDEGRREAYRDYFMGHSKTIIGTDSIPISSGMTEYSYFNWPVRSLEAIYIASDGVQSFINIESALLVSLNDVMLALTSLKNTTDAFIKRRLKRALKDWKRDGIVHSDDVALAAMVFEADAGGGVS